MLRSLRIRKVLFVLLATLLVPQSASAFMALVRQGSDSTEVPNTDDRFGRTVCSGDFNNDGFDDLAAAAPDEANGLINTAAHGVVIISPGSARGISTVGIRILSVGDLGPQAARFGWSMVAADFNQDDYDDLAVGIPNLDSITGSTRGAVWFFAGGPGGLQTAPYLQVDLAAVEPGPVDFAYFGWALTAGDFNDDTFPDVATSAIGQGSDTGTVYFLYGSNAGITLAGNERLFPFTVGGSDALGGRFGWALQAADLDGIRGDDLVIGAPETDPMGLTNAGRVYFYYSGGATGITGTGGWYLDAHNLPASAPITGDAHLGFSLAAGHFNQSSGFMDVAVGAPQNDYGQQIDAGAVFVVEFDTDPTTYDSVYLMRQSSLPSSDSTNASTGDQFGYALAAGNFDFGLYEDLAVGAPFEDVTEQFVLGQQSNAGIFHVYYGQETGLSTFNVETFDSEDLNNFVNGGDNLGQSLCFGRFDDSGRDNLAVGAPNADYDSYESGVGDISNAGQVHIHAPWRQPQGHPHRTSLALDCDGFVVYAQRPFQRVRPASTTKAMTLLLACEAIADGEIDPEVVGTVPPWVANQVGGSQTPLIANEKISFDGLMKTMMTVSGNDSAMLIGAALSGEGGSWQGWEGTSPSFAAAMETRANQLGLSSAVSLTNAAGIDAGDHYVTALDWASLAYQVIRNDCVREIVNTSPWEVERELPPAQFDGFMLGPTEIGDFTTTFYAGWVDGVKARYGGAVGLKPGGTPGGWRTGISAGNPPGPTPGYSAVSTFGTRRDDEPIEGVTAGCSTCLHGELLLLAEGHCEGSPTDLVPPADPAPKPWGTLTSIPGCQSEPGRAMAISLGDEQIVEPGRLVQIDLMRHSFVQPRVTVRQVVTRDSRVRIGPGESVPFGIGPHEENLGLEIINAGDTTAFFEVEWNGTTTTHVSDPGMGIVVAGVVASQGQWSFSIVSATSAGDIVLDVQEKGYLYENTLGDGITMPDAATLQITRGGNLISENIVAYVRGQESGCDDTLDLVARDTSVTATGVDDGDGSLPPAPATFQLLPNYPNPFNPSTIVRFDLPRDAEVDLAIYDVRGRRVKSFATGRRYAAGRHQLEWLGTDDAGRSVASGVYLLRLRSEGRDQTQRMTLLK